MVPWFVRSVAVSVFVITEILARSGLGFAVSGQQAVPPDRLSYLTARMNRRRIRGESGLSTSAQGTQG
jgi:hypothetical protein